MKHEFVLDEGVVICAATGELPDGTRSLDPERLVTTILDNCHALAADNAVYARWSRQLDRLKSAERPLAPTLLSLLASVAFRPDKFRWYTPSALSDESNWSTKLLDDRDFVRLAAECHGILSTLDAALIEDIHKLGLDNRYEFGVADVEGALALAVEPAS